MATKVIENLNRLAELKVEIDELMDEKRELEDKVKDWAKKKGSEFIGTQAMPNGKVFKVHIKARTNWSPVKLRALAKRNGASERAINRCATKGNDYAFSQVKPV